MANRFSDWEERMSKELIKSKKRRKGIFLELRKDIDNDLVILRMMVSVIGLKEFGELSGLAPSNLSNYLKVGKDLKISTLRKMMKPFGIKMVNIPLDQAA